MLTYTPPNHRIPTPTHEKPWLLLLMAFAWLWPGVFSHGLWNPAEPELFTAIQTLQQSSSPWLPKVFEQIDFTISPVYLWVASIFQILLSPWATDPYSAARFSSVFFTALGLGCCGFSGFHFLGRHHGRSVVLILIGCVGLLFMAHFLNDTSVVFAALSMCLCGFSLANKRVIIASLLLSTGWVLLSLSAGYMLTGAFMLMALLLLLHPQWQFKRYYLTLFGALVIALPLLTLYPFLLFKLYPDVFPLWINHHIFDVFGGIHHFQTAFNLPYYLKNLLWFAFPAWPLAIWTLSRTHSPSQPWRVLCIIWLITITLLLAFSPQRIQNNLIWLMPPLALLGAARLDGLRRGAAAFLNWFGIMAFGLLAAFLWLGFAAINYGWPAKLAERSHYFSPYYLPDIDIMPMIIAVSFTPLWLWAITRSNIKGRQAITNWAAGVTLSWALLMTLLLPWFDAAKSHQPIVQQMEASLSPELKQQFIDNRACINIAATDTRTRIVWTQYSHLKITIDNPNCRYRIMQQPKGSVIPSGWTLLWEGARPRNKIEHFIFLEKTS